MNRKIKDLYPVNAIQKSMLFHSEKDRENYSVKISMTLTGMIEHDRLAAAFSKVVERHDSLRTIFPQKNYQKLMQVVFSEVSPSFKVLHTNDISEQASENFWKEAPSFDLEKGPLVKACLFIAGEESARLDFLFHHIIIDGWSLDIFLRDFFSAYAGKELPEPAQYKQYVKWQSDQLLTEGAQHYQEYLAGYEEPVHLEKPVFSANSGVKTKRFTVSSELTEALLKQGKSIGITASTLFQTAWGLTVAKLYNKSDFIFGNVVSGRNVPIEGIENTIGLFINTLPVRIQYQKDERLSDLLLRMQKFGNKALELEAYPLEKIIAEHPLRQNLFNTIIGIENYDLDLSSVAEGTNLSIQEFTSKEQSHFPLSISVYPGSKTELLFTWQTGLFTEKIISTLAEAMLVLIEEMSRGFHQIISELQVVDQQEFLKLTKTFNASNYQEVEHQTLKDLVESVFESARPLEAVTDGNETWTYQELENKASYVATRIAQYGLDRNQIVAIYEDRGLNLMALIFGTILAGHAFLLLDPHLPEARLESILADSNAELLLTIDCEEPVFHTGACPVIDFKSSELVPGTVRYETVAETKADDTAYVIYTSGTTGKPKGVLLSSKASVNMADYLGKFIGNKQPVSIALSSLSFDMFISDLLYTFVSGGKVVITSEAQRKDNAEITQAIIQHQVTSIFATPSRVNSLLITNPEVFTGVENIILGGEKIDEQLIEKMNDYSEVQLFNAYGPSEGTVYNTLLKIDSNNKHYLGKPAALSELFILNEEKNVVPCGVTGEICIAGTPVGKGYINRSDLTASKFIENPFDPTTKMYLTGDLGSWSADGFIEYTGRKDDQIKIRGLRIEVKEIEATISKIAGVSNVVVFSYENKSQQSELACVITGEKNEVEIKEILTQSLPDYMIPTHILSQKDLRMTPAGKFDRRYYVDLILAKNNEVAHKKPTTENQEKLFDLWAEVLGHSEFGIEDQFFAVGGNSLTAMIICSKIQSYFEISFRLHDFFEAATILSQEAVLSKNDNRETLILTKREVQASYPLTKTETRLFSIFEATGKESKVYNLIQGLEIKDISFEQLEKALEKIVDSNHNLRANYTYDTQGTVQKYIRAKDNIVIERYENLVTDTELEQVTKSFDLEHEPLYQFIHVKNSDRELLLLNFHHIIIDGLSVELLLKQLANIFDGQETVNKFQFTDYALMEQSLLSTSTYKQSEKYWEKMVTGYSNHESVRTVDPKANGKNNYFTINHQTLSQLKQTAKNLNMSLYQLTFALFSILRCRTNNLQNHFIGTISSGRSIPNSEEIVGMFANTLPVRLTLEKKTVKEILLNQREMLVGAVGNDMFPLNEIIEKANEINGTEVPQLFNELFILQEIQNKTELSLGSMVSLDNNFNTTKPKFPLIVEAEAKKDQIRFLVNYDETIYSSEQINNMMESYLQLLTNVEEVLHQQVDEFEFLTVSEQNKLLQFRGLVETENADETVQEYLSYVFNNHKTNSACKVADKEISYEVLDKKSAALAQQIMNKTEKKNVPIAILMNRSVEIPLAVIAVLRAGASFVLIDKDLPEERITYMLDSAGIGLVLTNDPKTKPKTTAEIWTIGESDTNIDQVAKENSYHPEDAAYIIYTSGTTGNPKGVVNTNKGLLNSMKNIVALAEKCGTSGNVLSLTAVSFDMFIVEMFMALGAGRTLVIATEEERLDNDQIVNHITKKRISLLWATPSRIRMMLCDSNYCEALKQLDGLFLGGEALDQATADLLISYNEMKLFNMYGPSEAAVFCSGKELSIDNNKVTIGCPAPGNTIDIVDVNNRLLPIGVTGEIVISGHGVGKGYLGEPKKTAESFVMSTYEEHQKIYKTGDLGQWNEDGEIVYLGRKDDQIKIRGFRVELQEIEAVLKQMRGIREAVVVLKEEGDHQFLTAFLVGEFDEQDLTIKLSEKLPYYFIPDFFVSIDEVPLTVAGKINTRALKEIPLTIQNDSLEQMTELEQKVAGYFNKVLGTEVKNSLESFYRLGGDSIKVIQLVGKMRADGINVSVKDIVALKNVKAIAKHINETLRVVKTVKPAFEGISETTSLEKQYLQKNHPDILFNQSIVLQTNQKKRTEYEQLIEALLKQHDSLRSKIIIENGQSQHVILPDNDLIYILEEITVEEKDVKKELESINKQVQTAIKPTEGKMLSACIIHTEAFDYLFLAISHLVIDGVSWRIIENDLNRFVEQLNNKQEIQLLEKSDLIHDFSTSLASAKDGLLFEGERNYWEKASVTPTDAESCLMKDVKTKEHVLSKKETTQLQAVFKSKGLKFDTALLSSYLKALMTINQSEQTTVFFESHGRLEEVGEIDLSQSVGWFTSVYPLQFSNRDRLWDVVRDVKLTLDKVPNLGVGFGYLAEKDGSGKLYDMYHSHSKHFFNYLGEMGGNTHLEQIFNITDLETGQEISESVDLSIGISLNAVIINQVLKVSVLYNQGLYSEKTIEHLLSMIIEYLSVISEAEEHLENIEIKQSATMDIDLDELDTIFNLLSEVV
ncbi:amino acid adenylation domain-containing protein [Enterococcus rotai]|uniref:amino acid adenylation domain-containing protein n=1 Tax=Enterococcus rotai TaxID=118060 RepID=UPI0035C75DF2